MLLTKIGLSEKPKLKQLRKINKKLPEKLDAFSLDLSERYVKNLRFQLLKQKKQAPRDHLAKTIKYKRQRRWLYQIKMGYKAHYLDSARPHFVSVSLKKWRRINDWAEKYYYKNKIPPVLFVTPDPFVDKALVKTKSYVKKRTKKFVSEVTK